MRILHIIPELNKGGAERLVVDVCNELEKRKSYDIEIIVFRSKNAYLFDTSNLKINTINASVHTSILRKQIVNIQTLQQFIDNFKPSIIHSHLFESEVVLSKIECGNAKRFVHFHNNMPQFKNISLTSFLNKVKITNLYEKYLVLKAWRNYSSTHAIGVSNDTFEYIKTVLPRSAKKSLLLNAISLKRFQLEHPKERNMELCMIGSLTDNKCQELAILTIEQLHHKNYPFHLHLLGDGPNKNRLINLSKEKKLDKFIHFHGNVDHPEYFLARAFVYIHTSHSEALGLSILEAMAAHTPVVCTNGKGNKDLINHNENGFIFDKRDEKLLANQIIALWKDKDKYEKIQVNAFSFVQGFDISLYCDRLVELYENYST